jgi:hypothetical protein
MAMPIVYIYRNMSEGEPIEIRHFVIPNGEFKIVSEVQSAYPQPKFFIVVGSEELWDEPAPLAERCPGERIFDRRVDAIEWLNNKYNLTQKQYADIDYELGAWITVEPPTSSELIWAHPSRCIEEFTEPVDVEAIIRQYAEANAAGESQDDHFPSRISESGLEKIYKEVSK